MKEWISKIKKYRAKNDIRQVLFNIIDIAALVGGTISMISSYAVGMPFAQVVVVFVAVVVLAIAFYIANFRKNVNVAAFIIVFVISLVLFPIMFYTGGGLYGGMGYWYLLGIIFNFLLIEGVSCYILLVLQVALTLFCFIHTYYHPEVVIQMKKDAMYVDVVQSLIVVALIVGLIVRFQNRVYKEKLKELSEMNEEKERLAKLAEDANRAKSDFLAQMSHEIRTPINAVLGMNEMILRESEDKGILEYAENIDSAGNTLLSLINSILDFSKIEDGKMDIVPVKYDTASFINDLYHSIIQRADTKGLALIFDVDSDLPCTMIGDDVRFSQVIMNLLTNAVKYTEKGSVTLSIKEIERKAVSVKLHVSVKDTGIGIKEEDLGRLYESFERLDEVRNHSIEGTGLGISIVTNLLKLMGSSLDVKSVYGEGSDFSFTIEQKIANNMPIGDYKTRLNESGKRRDSVEIIDAPGAHILVVDDNEMNLKVARNLLKLCKIKSDEVSSGEDAISLMSDNAYDIVFLDHMMPGMDGIETLNRMKKEKLIPEHTVMIALTANAVVGARENYLEAGFSDYLSKPIEIKHLVEKLKTYLPEEAYRTAETGKNVETTTETDGIMEFAPEEDGIFEFNPDEENETEHFGESDGRKGNYDIEILSEMGIDTAAGLNYCAGDKGLYFEMLGDFVSAIEGKLESLDSFFRTDDWKEYEVAVHALKSNARTIGANDLYEQARCLEEAAERGDTEYIKENHKRISELGRGTVDAIRKSEV